MRELAVKKVEFLKRKKEEYIAQIAAINGAIQALEELIKEHDEDMLKDTVKEDN